MIAHILIIDADPSAAHTTRALVARIAPEATVTLEATPERGWVSMRQRPAEVLIIDPSPHELAAAELIQWLRTERPAAGVVVLASNSPSALRQKMGELGVDLYQDKHQPPAELIQQLRGALQKIARSVQVAK
jgi:DNA-binding NarL/FixJ family response regulator